ncbi:GGDEF domain-containing protein [Pseudoalteromonas pernae]|uniref:GGDEF domain-containing protein n=1 Tax=Pseudoalteromonas pernae TaxID=3118054 RepID=UPI003241F3B9
MHQHLFKAIIENNSDAVVIADIDDGIVFWNCAAQRMFGYSFDEVNGQDPHDLLTVPSNRDFAKHSKEVYRSTRKSNILGDFIRLKALTKDNKELDIDLQINAIELEGKTYIYTFIRDVSDLVMLERQTEHLLNTDTLTQIKNRYRFTNDMDWLVERSRKYKTPLSIGIIDIDHFKSINDSYGHAAGDYALKTFAKIVSDQLCNRAVFARLGGEEFAIAFADTYCYEAVQAVEDIRHHVEQQILEFDGQQFSLTFSCGLASLQGEECNLGSLLKDADKALYEAKEQGRNRTILFRH